MFCVAPVRPQIPIPVRIRAPPPVISSQNRALLRAHSSKPVLPPARTVGHTRRGWAVTEQLRRSVGRRGGAFWVSVSGMAGSCAGRTAARWKMHGKSARSGSTSSGRRVFKVAGLHRREDVPSACCGGRSLAQCCTTVASSRPSAILPVIHRSWQRRRTWPPREKSSGGRLRRWITDAVAVAQHGSISTAALGLLHRS